MYQAHFSYTAHITRIPSKPQYVIAHEATSSLSFEEAQQTSYQNLCTTAKQQYPLHTRPRAENTVEIHGLGSLAIQTQLMNIPHQDLRPLTVNTLNLTHTLRSGFLWVS